MDSESTRIVERGATVLELSKMFGKKAVDVRKLLEEHHIRPCTEVVDGFVLYRVKDVAGHLCTMPEDVVDRVMRLNHADLPKMLSKEYWYGQNQRLNYEERVGNLWSTEDVMVMVNVVFKKIKMSVMLFTDRVERQVTLTEKQRSLIMQLSRTLLENLEADIKHECEQRKSQAVAKSGQSERSGKQIDTEGSADDDDI